MIWLLTGTPGSFKTCNAIKLLSELKEFEGRDIYYHNINGLTLDWKQLDDDSARMWYDLPNGSVVVLDEAQAIFPPRKAGSAVPERVSQLNTHRHKGIDIFIITQHPSGLDVALRRLVGRHYHLDRPFGAAYCRAFVWNKCNDRCDDGKEQYRASKEKWKAPKKYFSAYKSAEIHTHKFTIPKRMIFGFGLPLVITLGLGGFAYSRLSAPDLSPSVASGSVSRDVPAGLFPPAPVPQSKRNAVNYAEDFIPRIPGLMHTAPAYDGVFKVTDFPRPAACIIRQEQDTCKCYTQQMTHYQTSDAICRSIVENGWFNPARGSADKGNRRSGGKPQPRTRNHI
ncbi:zonular occludens toxin domain-containing protein [Kistimonas asteriae]|uniref:zonular occludens toxin domain-containing protein n=1 Tax=Kistimonas asteriae TaxID=517724 RepID=UPI001BA857B4|nr:zonular occludens toxin domain-containing protein [Kistimonas asteriae]